MASASSSMLPATISWLAALTVCPEPAGPTCTMVLPTASRIGLAAAKSSAAPPTMIDSVGSTAPASPPLTGASTHAEAALGAGLGHPAATSGRMVEQSMCSVPGLALAKIPSSPSDERPRRPGSRAPS